MVAQKDREFDTREPIWTPPKLIECQFCGYEFEEACGKKDCPNCEGEDPE